MEPQASHRLSQEFEQREAAGRGGQGGGGRMESGWHSGQNTGLRMGGNLSQLIQPHAVANDHADETTEPERCGHSSKATQHQGHGTAQTT